MLNAQCVVKIWDTQSLFSQSTQQSWLLKRASPCQTSAGTEVYEIVTITLNRSNHRIVISMTYMHVIVYI